MAMLQIKICMGSSCFTRGNNLNLSTIKTCLKEAKVEADIDLSGSLCEGCCNAGPNVVINGKLHSQVTQESIPSLIASALNTLQTA